jgi:hypothetical protein
MLFAERGTARCTLVHVRMCHTCRMRSRINVPTHTAACSACGGIVCPRACTVRGVTPLYPTHPYAPWCAPQSRYVRVCVRDLGGRGSDGPCHGRYSKQRAWIAFDDGRWRRRADLRREQLRRFVCLRRPNLRIPEQCARGGSTTTADGDRMHARARNTDHAPCSMRQTRPASDAQQTSCR